MDKRWYQSKTKVSAVGYAVLQIAKTVFPQWIEVFDNLEPVIIALAGIGLRDAIGKTSK